MALGGKQMTVMPGAKWPFHLAIGKEFLVSVFGMFGHPADLEVTYSKDNARAYFEAAGFAFDDQRSFWRRE